MARPKGRGEQGKSGRRAAGIAAIAAVGALAPAAAEATSFAESTVGDFGNTHATRFSLPAGTDVVTGFFPFESFDVDNFAFADLVPGLPFSVELSVVSTDAAIGFRLFDDAANPLSAQIFLEFGTTTVTGVVPASGEVVVRASVAQDFGSYQVTIDATHVPEPSTGVLAGLGLGALSFLRRRIGRE